jgi:gliding motility-associated-like protein
MRHTLFFLFLLVAIPIFSQNKNQSIGFKENKGQIIDQKGKPNPDVKYLLNTNGLNVQIKTNGFSYDIYETKKHPIKHIKKEKQLSPNFPETDKEKLPDYSLEYIYHRIDIDFVDSNPKVELITEQKSKDYDNYYNIPNKPDGVLMVHQYQQITYKNIYPNIDVVFSIPKDSLKAVEYNFVVHPNGKISDIQLKFNGAKTELVDNKIRMQVRFGVMEETLPMSWTEDGKNKKEIAIGYTKIKKNVYGFASAENVSGKTVVIDPVPTRLWGTFYGGEKEEDTKSLEIDILGNSYICGITSSMNFIATSDAHQNVFGSSFYYGPYLYITDGFVAKFDEKGNRLWSTFYGGNVDDDITDLAVSNNGLIGFCGNSWSNNNISTIGSFKNFKSGSYGEMYFGVLNTNGVRLWASYYGNDNGITVANCILVDKQNYFYLAGTTTSDAYISTPNSFKETIIDNNRFDGFLAKFDQNGNRIWGTYFGGDKDDYIEDLIIDSSNNIILVGYTISTNGVSTPNSFQQYLSSDQNYDGFITSFTNNGIQNWGTYFGSIKDDKIFRVKNFNNTLYFSGTTNNNDLATPNAFETINQNGYFISKFNIQNQKKIWLSYSSVKITDFDINQNEEIYLVGESSNISNIATPNAFNPVNIGSSSFIRKINNNCGIIWGTYLGSQGFINDPYIKYLNNDIFYVAGTCYSYWSSPQFTNYGLTTPNSYQEISNGNREAYINKFKDCNLLSLTSSNSPICIGKTLELKASGGTNYSWTGPNGFTSTDQNPIIPNATASNNGQYSCSITGTGGCDGVVTVDVFVGDNQPPVPNLLTLPTITGDCKTQITTIPTATDACAGAITATTTSPLSYSLPGTYTIVWNYNDGNGNSVPQNQTVIISSQPLPTATSPQTFCFQQNETISSITITGQNIKWYDALTNGNPLNTTSLVQDGITYYASQTINGCESERTPILINIQNTLAPTGNSTQTFCTAQNPTITNLIVTGNAIKWYDSLNNGSLLTPTTNLVNGKTYYASQTTNTCESERFGVSISIVNTPSAPTANTNQSFCKKENATLNTIQISGQNIKWYDTNLTVVTLPNTTILENNKTYYASQTIGCESARTAILIQVYDTPLPIGNTNQQFCVDENATLSNFNIAGSNIKWYDELTNGTVLAVTTLLQNGKTYYATQTLNNCESERVAIFAKIQDTPIPIANSPQTFCVQKNAKISDIVIEGQNITWFENASSSINLSESTLLKNGITYYASQNISYCESDRIPISITIHEATAGDCINLVDELPYLKFFTPNNDGYNDYWTIDFAYLKTNTEIQIFDRYGKLIKTLTSNSSKWNGTFNGAELPASDYWFVVTRVNGVEYKGHFSLKR